MRKSKRLSVNRQDLIQAVQNTYDDTRFLVGIGVDDGCDFFTGPQVNCAARYSKGQILNAIHNSSLQVFPTMREFSEQVVLNNRLYLSLCCI